jgi:hypothetical protein
LQPNDNAMDRALANLDTLERVGNRPQERRTLPRRQSADLDF